MTSFTARFCYCDTYSTAVLELPTGHISKWSCSVCTVYAVQCAYLAKQSRNMSTFDFHALIFQLIPS